MSSYLSVLSQDTSLLALRAHGKALDINETRSTWPVRIGERRHLLAETEITLKVGESLQLKSFSGNDFNLYEDIAANAGKEFKSANDAVAEISEGGLVTGRKRGITNVYVKSGSMISACKGEKPDYKAKDVAGIGASRC